MKNKNFKALSLITLLLIIIDQISKLFVLKFYSTSIVGNELLGIELVYNTGLAFGFNDGNIKNIFLTIFVLIVILNFIINQIERIDKRTIIALSLVISGGIGNLIDRFLRGSVVDFIKIYKIPNFNFADFFVVVGWILLIIFLIDYTRKN